MGAGHCVGVHGASVGHCLPCKAVTVSVMACIAAGGSSLHCSRCQSTESKGSGKKNSFEHLFGEIVRKGWESPASKTNVTTISLAIASPVPCYASQATWSWGFGSALVREPVRVDAVEWMDLFVRIGRALMVCL